MKHTFALRIDYTNLLISLIIPQIFAINTKNPWNAVSKITYSTCNNYKCVERARYLENSLDTSVNPCNDFYQYACGGWIKKHPVPTTEMEYSIETYLKLLTMNRVKHLLEQDDHHTDKKEVKIARQIYHECMNRHQLGRLNPNVVRYHLNKQEPWSFCPMFNDIIEHTKSWVKVLEYFLEITTDAPLFDILITLNKNKKPTIQVEELTYPFVMLDIVRWNQEKEHRYMRFLKQMIESLKMFKLKHCQIYEYIREVVQFRKKLDEIVEFILTPTDGEKSVEEMTIEQFQKWYDDITARLKAKANIPWLDVIQAAYPTVNDVRVNKDTKINVQNKEYFHLLANLLNETPLRVIVNHILLYFMEGHLQMDSKLMKSLKGIILHDDTFYDDLIIDTDKLHFCILNHPMTTTLANMYNEAYLTKEIEEKVYDLAYDIKDMLKVQMAESKWLHSKVKYELGQKLSRTNAFIGIKYMTQSNEKRPWIHERNNSVTKVEPSILPEATYVINNEYVLIGTGYLQSPVYEEEMPYVVNYGSLGTLLGHEFFHTFQSAISSKYNNDIRKEKNMTSNIYEQKTECFVNHYKDFVKDLNDMSVYYRVRPDLVRAVDENIADIMGLKGAYEAYRRKLSMNNSTCQTLPIHNQLSCDQLFFLSFALTFCGNIPSIEIRKILKHLVHLPSRARVNGAVSNLEAFNDAFHCSNKAPLNSKKKCDIWE